MYNSVIAGYSRSPFAMANKGKLIDLEDMNERRLMKDAFGDYFKLPEVTNFAET